MPSCKCRSSTIRVGPNPWRQRHRIQIFVYSLNTIVACMEMSTYSYMHTKNCVYTTEFHQELQVKVQYLYSYWISTLSNSGSQLIAMCAMSSRRKASIQLKQSTPTKFIYTVKWTLGTWRTSRAVRTPQSLHNTTTFRCTNCTRTCTHKRYNANTSIWFAINVREHWTHYKGSRTVPGTQR